MIIHNYIYFIITINEILLVLFHQPNYFLFDIIIFLINQSQLIGIIYFFSVYNNFNRSASRQRNFFRQYSKDLDITINSLYNYLLKIAFLIFLNFFISFFCFHIQTKIGSLSALKNYQIVSYYLVTKILKQPENIQCTGSD